MPPAVFTVKIANESRITHIIRIIVFITLRFESGSVIQNQTSGPLRLGSVHMPFEHQRLEKRGEIRVAVQRPRTPQRNKALGIPCTVRTEHSGRLPDATDGSSF